MKTFTVTFSKKAEYTAEIEIEAETMQEAEEIARIYDCSKIKEWDWDNEWIDYDVDGVECEESDCGGCSVKECQEWSDSNEDLQIKAF